MKEENTELFKEYIISTVLKYIYFKGILTVAPDNEVKFHF
jgi:hypothetical protein